MKKTTIKITAKIKGPFTKIKARRSDNQQIDIEQLLKPYINKGLRILKLNYVVGDGLLKATLVSNK